MATIKHLNR